jgi:hypothetical protein
MMQAAIMALGYSSQSQIPAALQAMIAMNLAISRTYRLDALLSTHGNRT